MPTQPINIITEDATLEQLINELAKLQKMLRYLLNGQIDFENIRARSIKADNIEVGTLTAEEIMANTITADKMNVTELSAIVANLGTITAGVLNAVTIIGSVITGGTLRTAASGERIELSSDSFKSYNASEQLNGLVLGQSAVNYGDVEYYSQGTLFFKIMPSAFPPGIRLASFNGQDFLIGDGNQSIRINNGSSLDNISQSDSTATTVGVLVTDFNTLLSNLRSMNILA